MATNNVLTNPGIHARLEGLASFVARYGLVVVIAWIGALKFTAYEAEGIQPLVANSPLLSWLYNLFSVQTFSNLLGFSRSSPRSCWPPNPSRPNSRCSAASWRRCCS